MRGQLQEFARAMETRRSLYQSDEYVTSRLLDLIENHVVLVDERDGRLVGYIVGVISPNALNPEITQLVEILWWVDPEFRGGTAAARLLAAFIDRGREVAHWVFVSPCLAGDGAELGLERAGFRLVQKQYLREVN